MAATATDSAVPAGHDLRVHLVAAARTLATATLIGALSGLVVVGVLARLAMRLLAVLNPEAAGVTSDDGFTMGQFTLEESLQLALAGVQLGVVGAAFYLAVRGLMIGPAWFRLLSISLGPAVVVGAILVHTDGVDFTLLDPPGLAIAMFVALPGLRRHAAPALRTRHPIRPAASPAAVRPGSAAMAAPAASHAPAGWRVLGALGGTAQRRRAGEHSSPILGPAGSRGPLSRHCSSSPQWTWQETSAP